MKILIVANKTLPRVTNDGKLKGLLDSTFYNVYVPLLELGHTVYFYDTVSPVVKDFNEVYSKFKPDFIFCCITGNSQVTPYEPLEEIEKITKTGNCITFNWFCDDMWRFDTFSKTVCNLFYACSTPEPSYIQKYKDINYNNIVLGSWHVSNNLYCKNTQYVNKVSFAGGMTNSRADFLNNLKIPITYVTGVAYEDLFNLFSSSLINLNLTVNDNDPKKQTQMKLRIFEVASTNGFLLTQYTPHLEEFFDLDKEIAVFNTIEEAKDKINFYLNNEKERKRIAYNGYLRYVKEHTSKFRLKTLLSDIDKL
jgi:spore maturation protein CgeB